MRAADFFAQTAAECFPKAAFQSSTRDRDRFNNVLHQIRLMGALLCQKHFVHARERLRVQWEFNRFAHQHPIMPKSIRNRTIRMIEPIDMEDPFRRSKLWFLSLSRNYSPESRSGKVSLPEFGKKSSGFKTRLASHVAALAGVNFPA